MARAGVQIALHGLPADEHAQFPRRVAAVTAGDVHGEFPGRLVSLPNVGEIGLPESAALGLAGVVAGIRGAIGKGNFGNEGESALRLLVLGGGGHALQRNLARALGHRDRVDGPAQGNRHVIVVQRRGCVRGIGSQHITRTGPQRNRNRAVVLVLGVIVQGNVQGGRA